MHGISKDSIMRRTARAADDDDCVRRFEPTFIHFSDAGHVAFNCHDHGEDAFAALQKISRYCGFADKCLENVKTSDTVNRGL